MKLYTALLGTVLLCLFQLVASSKRVIVSYKQNGRSAVTSSWTKILEPINVNLVKHNTVDRFAVLEGSEDDINSAISSMPWIDTVEEDFIVKIQVAARRESTRAQSTCINCLYKDTFPSTPGSTEIIPYGINMVQGNPDDSAGSTTLSGPGVTVCVIDSGIYTQHPDLVTNVFDGATTGPFAPYPYNQPDETHGTHVTGTIAAIRNNNIGVAGVIPFQANIYGIDALPDHGTGYSSLILDALSFCEQKLDATKAQDPNARMVVQMSFGSSDYSSVNNNIYTRMYARGDMLFVAASGNEQLDTPNILEYPASYPSVISVGAVDCNATIAPFSIQNERVELVAPGVDVDSTVVPFKPRLARLNVTSGKTKKNYIVSPVTASPAKTVTAPVVDCGMGQKPCPAARGKICLISRGVSTFACKHQNAQLGGCAGLLIYNNVDPPCLPLTAIQMNNTDCPPLNGKFMPTATMTKADGQDLAAKIASQPTRATINVGISLKEQYYQSYDGTSMATPHVSGVAARVWGAFPTCTNQEIRNALAQSAMDLGPPGRDNAYGYGLVQAQAAVQYLQQNPCVGKKTIKN